YFIRVDAAGGYKKQAIEEAKAFFLSQFPRENSFSELPDSNIQRQLVTLRLTGNKESKRLADICLRCFISYQIKEICLQIERRFGERGCFAGDDLFSLVLDDDLRIKNNSYQPLAVKILEAFDPEKANLSTWTKKVVYRCQFLRNFLLQNGIFYQTSWSILNRLSIKELEKVLSGFGGVNQGEAEQFKLILKSYHDVYRTRRRQQQKKGRCEEPTQEELQEIADLLPREFNLSASKVLKKLQIIAENMRQDCVAKSGYLPKQELTNPDGESYVDPLEQFADIGGRDRVEIDFQIAYGERIFPCLERGIEGAIANRVNYLKRRKKLNPQDFLKALELFYRGTSMGEIAPLVGLKGQPDVSRKLLKLKEFRADVKRLMLLELQKEVKHISEAFVSSKSLEAANQKIEEALDAEISEILAEAKSESLGKTSAKMNSYFAAAICQYFDKQRSK
ncbi:MAG: hypothetical protein F6K35_41700, partial [Okeania sp. SIO2H7]|nr:hypothetical protein [Okeania sp. SIO2H7]